MRLTKTIIGQNFSLAGFMVRGKQSEFGEVGNSIIEKPITLEYLMGIKFNNTQAYFNGKNITEKGSFHLNQLGMLSLDENKNLCPINNTVEITSRYVRNNENIGFGVKFGNGNENKYKYSDVIKLSELFRPLNFVIKVTAGGQQFIAGKSGNPLSNVPEIVVEQTDKKKRMKSGAKPVEAVTGKFKDDIDILDIFDFVKGCEGYIIKFASTEYAPTGEKIEKSHESFRSLEIGEVASPYLTFNESKFNISCGFKVPGTIQIGPAPKGPVFAGSGAGNIAYTYLHRTKNIFFNGKNQLSKIGLIIPNEMVSELYDKFSSSMALTEITDEKVIAVVNRLINWENSKIFEVDVSKLSMVSPKKYDNYILSIRDLAETTNKLAVTKIAYKYVRGAIKELNSIGYYSAPKNKDIAAQFKGKSEQELKVLMEAGIDIYNGAFYKQGETVKNESAASNTDIIPEVEYIIDGIDPDNYTFKKLVESPEKCPEAVISMIEKVKGVDDFSERIKLLNKMETELDKVEYEQKRKLWLHKTSMWLKANKLGVHKDDKWTWELNTKKRTKATCYNCIIKGAEGLQILLTDIDIIK